MLIISLCTVFFFISVSEGDDFFESLSYRQYCYKDEQCGCNKTLIEEYPHLAKSYSGLTKADTHMYLFTRESPEEPELLHKCPGTLPPNSTFNPNCTTEIYLPGFTSGICNFAIYRELKNERLKCGCYNVILVDWMWGNKLDLIEAKENMYIVAKQVCIIINYLKKKYGLGPEKFILTGHSYGAHMAAFIANCTDDGIGIINGIDPAGVVKDFAEDQPIEGRLDRNDAPCVNVLHSNAGQCLPCYFGLNYSCGTADFWYNGGKEQLACKKQIFLSFIKFDWFYALITLFPAACSHLQSLYYYKASMDTTDCLFAAVKCDSVEAFNNGSCVKDSGPGGNKYALAGAYGCQCLNDIEPNKTNNYYLNTTKYCPYCNDSGMNTTELMKCNVLEPCRRQPPLGSTTTLPLTTKEVTTPKLTTPAPPTPAPPTLGLV